MEIVIGDIARCIHDQIGFFAICYEYTLDCVYLVIKDVFVWIQKWSL